MIDWDEWRRRYAEMSYAEQQTFYTKVWDRHPVQQHFNADAAKAFFSRLPDRMTMRVVEIGGWNGELASILLPGLPRLWTWTNLEICREAVESSPLHDDDRFLAISPADWPWASPRTRVLLEKADVLVASHVIEHMSTEHLEALLTAAAGVEWMFLASPLPVEGPVDWTGYVGSHILPLGWDGVDRLASEHGWIDIVTWGETRWYWRPS